MSILPTLIISAFIGATAPTETPKIEALIQAVENLQGATFLRNGTEHTPKEAGDHLRLKWLPAGPEAAFGLPVMEGR